MPGGHGPSWRCDHHRERGNACRLRSGSLGYRPAHSQQHDTPRVNGCFQYRRKLIVAQFLGGLHQHDKRLIAGSGLLDHLLDLIGLARQRLRRQDRQDHLARRGRQDPALRVGGKPLDHCPPAGHAQRRILAEVTVHRATARHLDDEFDVVSHRWSIAPALADGLAPVSSTWLNHGRRAVIELTAAAQSRM